MYMAMDQTNVTIEQVASKALQGDDRLLRGMVMALLRENPNLTDITRPQTDDHRILAASASLLELFAQRSNQSPPEWTKEIGPLPEPVYLVNGIGEATTKFIRRLADDQSPEPLRKRGFLATPNYLTFV
jgi:hypothetical protein